MWNWEKMERAKGFEPSRESKQVVEGQEPNVLQDIAGSRIGSRISDSDRHDLARVVASWAKLHPVVKKAIIAMVSSADG